MGVTSDIVAGLKIINSEVKKIKALVDRDDPDLVPLSRRINKQVYIVQDLLKGGIDPKDPQVFSALTKLYELCFAACKEVGMNKNLQRWVAAMQGEKESHDSN